MDKIYFLPGLFGSTLSVRGIPAWTSGEVTNGLAFILQLPNLLRCNADGTPQYTTTVTGLHSLYQPFVDALEAVALPYDWRLAPAVAAASLVEKIDEPGWVVVHSFGGPVALNLWQQLQAVGQESKVLGIIFIASPIAYDFANWTAYFALQGQDNLFSLLVNLATAGEVLAPLPAIVFDLATGGSVRPTDNLKSLMATWDSFGYLLPTDSTVRTQATWENSNPYVTQQWLDRGLAARQADRAIAPPHYYSIYGTGYGTYFGAEGYESSDGDGVVLTDERMPDLRLGDCTTTILVEDEHQGILLDELVVILVWRIIGGQPILGQIGTQTVICDTNGINWVYSAPPPVSTHIPLFLATPGAIIDP